MKGATWQEFCDQAYYGIDAFFKYHDKMYQFAGYYQSDIDKCYAYIDCWTEQNLNAKRIWEVYADNLEQRWQLLLNAPLFDGKTIQEVDDEIELIDWG